MSLDRRSFLLAGVCLTPGLAAVAAPRRRVVCFSCGGTRLAPALAGLGWRQGGNLVLEPRLLGDSPSQEQIDAAAREVAATSPDVIVAFMRERVGALVRATRRIPVVAALHDPVVEGFAQSLARPGGNVTGIAFSSPESVKLTFRLLGDALPRLKRIHTLESPGWNEEPTVKAVRGAITAERGYVFEPHAVDSHAGAVKVLDSIRDPREEALVVSTALRGFDKVDFSARVLRARIAVLDMTGQMETGVLLAAGLRHRDMWGRLAAIVDQILRGASPANIPFEQPMHAEVELDRRTAGAIGVTFPPELLMRATKITD